MTIEINEDDCNKEVFKYSRRVARKMIEEFNLSEKIEQTHFNEPIDMLKVIDVKEFIKQIKEMIEFEVQQLPNPLGISRRLNSQIDLLAGDELK